MKHRNLLAVTLLSMAVSTAAHATKLPKALTDADFYDDGAPDAAIVELGKNLFFDKILSGNLNASCATCHHVLTDTGDGLSLPIGEGGRGLGVSRHVGLGSDLIHERVPRNAPPIFNLGGREFEVMFHDGRIEVDASQPSGFFNPAGDNLPDGLDNVLAVQAMFPVQSAAEMAGQSGENSIADAAAIGDLAGPDGVWAQLADRLRAIPEYVDMFAAAFPDEVSGPDDVTYVQAANAIGAFEAVVWRADNSPFDKYLRGNKKAMSPEAKQGMRLFYGKKANCVSCHSGPFQTDQGFHAIALPQIGTGKGDNQLGHFDGKDDFGRERVTGDIADRFRFRTPNLRNVELTAPYGHDGAYDTLEAMVRHHLDPVASLQNYDQGQAVLPPHPTLSAEDFVVMDDALRVQGIADSNELASKSLNETEFSNLMAFLLALTDRSSIDIRSNTPFTVPSGITLAE